MSDGRLVKRVFSKHFMIFLLWQSRAQHYHKTTYTKSGISFIRMASVHVKLIKNPLKPLRLQILNSHLRSFFGKY